MHLPQLRAVYAVLLHCLLGAGQAVSAAETPKVLVERLPEGAVQPRLVRATDGTMHLIYLTGAPGAADVLYQSRSPIEGSKWTAPIRVNSQAGSAIATGTIRGAEIALGPESWVHITWNGSGSATPKPKVGNPFLYARRQGSQGQFSPQLNLNRTTRHLDGGGAIAADLQGNVYALWHSSGNTVPDGEEFRTVFLAHSENHGKTFSEERSISPPSLGACGCCGLSAFADPQGNLYALFRTAGQRENRDMVLLSSIDHGKSFTTTTTDPWKATQCPMSLPAIAPSASNGLILSWETGSKVQWTAFNGSIPSEFKAIQAPGAGKRKHPVTIQNAEGTTLHVWSEGTGWQKGGAVEWQLFDREGKALGAVHRENGLPVWDRPSASVLPGNKDFLVMF